MEGNGGYDCFNFNNNFCNVNPSFSDSRRPLKRQRQKYYDLRYPPSCPP